MQVLRIQGRSRIPDDACMLGLCNQCNGPAMEDGEDRGGVRSFPFFFLFKIKISRLVFSYVGSGMPIKHQSVDAKRAAGMWVGASEKGLRSSLYG